ncbi:Hypothetical_protein [Hexamita inflata]|uniref:Hypothetical_protein n=1 Tax=Hexamita inflata TaxID=28002 RepID=A0AA86RFX5_9EUKA|nr:Hypothetical protein HINF_LOCUS65449 [Hexamita inflata]
MPQALKLPNISNVDYLNSQSCFDRFAKVIRDCLQQLDSQILPSAVHMISHFLNIDQNAKNQFLVEVQQYQTKLLSESIYDQLFKKMSEINASCDMIQPANTFNATETEFTIKNTSLASQPSISPLYQFPAQFRVPIIKFQPPTIIIQEKEPIIREQTSTESSKDVINETKERKNKATSASEKHFFFREALMHVLKTKEEASDEQLCNIIKESKICMWKQISEYSNGMMTTKQVSDYFWKTFVRACYKDQLTQQDKNYLTQVAHQNPRSSAAYLYDVVKPRFEGRNVFHDNVKMFLNGVLNQNKTARHNK